MGNLQFTASIDDAKFNKVLGDIEDKIKKVGDAGKGTSFFNVSNLADSYAVLEALKDIGSAVVKVRGDFRKMEVSFVNLFKSKAEANALMVEIASMAAKSPFELKDIAEGAKQLISFGASAGTVITDLQMLGDVAIGTATPINELASAYTKMRERGIATSDELSKLEAKNIPIYEELAKVLYTNVDSVKKFADESRISFGQVQQAFVGMSSVGGVFNGVMQRESESLAGLIASFKNALEGMFNELGKSQTGIVNVAVGGATALVENYDTVVKILKVLIATYGTYKTGVISIAVAHKLVNSSMVATLYIEMARALGTLTTATKFQAVALGIQTKAQAALNVVTSINPYVAIATGIAALVSMYLVLSDETEDLKTANELLAEANKDVSSEINKQKAEISSLVSILENQNIADSVRLEAYEKLKNISPDIVKGLGFEAAKTADLTAEVNNYIFALERRIRLEANTKALKEAAEQKSDTEKELFEAIEGRDEFLKEYKNKYYGNAIIRIIAWWDEIKVSNLRKKYAESKEVLNRASAQYSRDITATDEDFVNAEISKLQILQKEAVRTSAEYKTLEVEINKLKAKITKKEPKTEKTFTEKLAEAEDFAGLSLLKTIGKTDSEYEAYIKKLTDTRGKFIQGSKEYNQFDKLIGSLKKSQKGLHDDAPAPFGSIAYWKEISSKASKALERINPLKDNSVEVKKQLEIRTKADAEAEKLTKQFTVQTFSQTLEEKKNLYEEYTQWVNLMGKESADNQYKELIGSNKSYKDYLDKEIAALETKVKNVPASAEDKQNLVKLKSESVRVFKDELDQKKTQYELYAKWVETYSQASADEQFNTLKKSGDSFQDYLQKEKENLENKVKDGTASETDQNNLTTLKIRIVTDGEGIDKFKQKIADAVKGAQSLTEQLEILAKEKELLNGSGDNSKLTFINQQIIEAESQRHKELKEFLHQVVGSEEKRKEIEIRYKNLRVALEKEYGDQKGKIYQDALEEINKKKKAELAEEDALVAMKSKEYQALTETIKNASTEQTRIVLEAERGKLKIIKANGLEATEEYKAQLKTVEEAEKNHKKNVEENWQQIANSITALGDAMASAGGGMGEFGAALSGIAGQISNIQKAFSKPEGEKAGMQDYASAIQGVISMVDAVISANKRRAEQEKQFAQERLSYENQYRLALNKGIGSAYKDSESIFLNDTEAKIKAGAKQLQDAQRKFQEAISKLNEGKAKVGQKDVIDGKTVGKLVATGALIGTIIPGVGNVVGAAVGAVVGGIVSLFAKKKKDLFGGLLEQYPELVKTGADGWKEINVEMAQALIASEQLDENTKQMVQTALDYGEAINEATAQIKEGILELTGRLGDTIRDGLINAFKSGEDAAAAFGKAVGNVIADIASKLLFTALFKDGFDKLEKEMLDSYSLDGDQSIVDDLTRFMGENKDKPKQYAEGIEVINDTFEEMGFNDIFGKDTNSNSLSGSIKSITEETAGVLAGQMNAIRMTQAINLEVNRSQLLALNKIASNSEFLPYLELLKSIDKKLSSSIDFRANS